MAVAGLTLVGRTTGGGGGGAAGACRFTVAVALWAGLAALVAVTVMLWAALIVAGAVYKPLTTLPTLGLSDQVTAVLLDPVTVGVMVADCPLVSEAVVGVTEIDTVGAGATSDIAAWLLACASDWYSRWPGRARFDYSWPTSYENEQVFCTRAV